MLIETKAGPQTRGNGSDGALRSGATGALITADAHGRFYEAVSRGNVFVAANQTGVTTQAGLSATTPALTLFNPTGSGVNVVLLWASAVFSVANAAAAVVWVATNTVTTAAAVTGTLVTSANALLGSNAHSRASCFTAATLPAAPIARAVLGVGLTGAITVSAYLEPMYREFNGGIVLGENTAISFQTSTAGGASSFFGEFGWEEVAI